MKKMNIDHSESEEDKSTDSDHPLKDIKSLDDSNSLKEKIYVNNVNLKKLNEKYVEGESTKKKS